MRKILSLTGLLVTAGLAGCIGPVDDLGLGPLAGSGGRPGETGSGGSGSGGSSSGGSNGSGGMIASSGGQIGSGGSGSGGSVSGSGGDGSGGTSASGGSGGSASGGSASGGSASGGSASGGTIGGGGRGSGGVIGSGGKGVGGMSIMGSGGTVAAVCSSGKTWTKGNGAVMRPGNDCRGCHSFTVSGTVFPTAHEPNNCDGTAAGGIRVVITGSDGATLTLTPDATSGNFYTSSALKTPFSAKLTNSGGGSRMMIAKQTAGNCNSCHTQNGANGSPGRIMAP